jgi:hyperosmotically inducible protein
MKQSILATLLALALAGCAGGAKQESTGEYIDDAVITAKVKSTLIDDREVRARDIKVETFKGVVHLSGTAGSAHESSKAARLTRGVPGVKSVRNDIVVR